MVYVCKLTQAYGQCQMWYHEAPEWVGCAITQVLSQNGWHKQLDSLSLSCPASSPLQSTSPISEQESLIEIATSGSVKIEFNQKPLPDFWIGLHSKYPALASHAVKTRMPFATMYLCESGFSALTSMKTKYRLCVEKYFRLRLSNTTQHCRVMCILSSTPFSLTCGELFTIFD